MASIMRLNPYQVWEIDAVEGWLDDMASQGLLLESRKGGYFIFNETEPQKTRHRIDVREDQYPNSKARQEEYRAFGWEYISPLDTNLDIYRAVDPDAVELNTDEALLRQTLEKSQRILKRTVIIGNFVLAVLLIAMLFRVGREGFFHILLTRSGLSLPVLLLWYIVLIIALIREIRAYRAIRRRDLLERSFHTREREAKGRRAVRWDYGLRLMICALLLIELIADGSDVREAVELADSAYAPYSVQEFLPEDAAENEGEYGFLSPRALCDEYFFGQFVASTGERDYDVTVYEIRWPWLARGYVREQARLANAEMLTVPGHEEAWFYTGTPMYYRPTGNMPDTQNLILLDGNRAIEISYFDGPADLRAAALALD